MKKIPEVKREFECPVCKMKWKGVMYYSCPKSECPIQKKVTY